jgi:hypothetical protein
MDFHRRDVRRVYGDRQDAISHGFSSFLFGSVTPGGMRWIVTEYAGSAVRMGFHRREVRVVCGDRQDVFSHGFSLFLFGSLTAGRSGGF